MSSRCVSQVLFAKRHLWRFTINTAAGLAVAKCSAPLYKKEFYVSHFDTETQLYSTIAKKREKDSNTHTYFNSTRFTIENDVYYFKVTPSCTNCSKINIKSTPDRTYRAMSAICPVSKPDTD